MLCSYLFIPYSYILIIINNYFQTYIGDVLIIINPYKPLDLYGEEVSSNQLAQMLRLINVIIIRDHPLKRNASVFRAH